MNDVDVLVIRHGQSVWNAEGRWQGQADPPLTRVGRRQAAIAALALSDRAFEEGWVFDGLASSDLERAHRTARIVGEVLDLSPGTHEGLRERHAGPFQGLTRAEINERFPGAIAERSWPTGYERDESLLGRVLPALRDVCAGHDRMLVVAHGGVIRALDRMSGAPDESIPNVGGRWYRLGETLSPGERCELVDPEFDHGVE